MTKNRLDDRMLETHRLREMRARHFAREVQRLDDELYQKVESKAGFVKRSRCGRMRHDCGIMKGG